MQHTPTDNRTAYLANSDRGRIRDRTISLGIDTTGARHWYRTPTEAVHVIDADDRQEHRVELTTERDVTDWVAFVADERGWADKHYGGVIDQLVEGLR